MTGLPLRGKKTAFRQAIGKPSRIGLEASEPNRVHRRGRCCLENLPIDGRTSPSHPPERFLCAPPDMGPTRVSIWGVVKRLEAFAFDTGGLTHYQSNLLAVAVLACGATLFSRRIRPLRPGIAN